MKVLLLCFGALVVWGAITGETGETGGPPTAATEIPTQGGHGGLFVLLLVVALVGWVGSRVGVRRIHIAPHRDHAHGVAEAIAHEALGHAAVGAGVRGTTRGIRARVFPDGSGWCEVPRGRMSLAESIAITRAGEYVAGPSGCESDRARAKRELRQAPRRYRAQVSAEADALVRQHAGSAFGQRVARSLERKGRFR